MLTLEIFIRRLTCLVTCLYLMQVLGSCGLKMKLEVPIDLVVFSWFDFPLVVPIEGEV